MQELTMNEIEQVGGGHPVVAVIGYVVGSTVVRSAVRGTITGVAAYFGYKLSQS